MGETTLEELRELTEEARPANPAGRCRDASKNLAVLLDSEAIPHERHQGRFRGMEVYGAQTAEHFYVTVPGTVIDDYDGEEVILDPTMDQFTSEYFHEGAAESYVPRSVMPNRFIVYPDDKIYGAYVSV